MSLNGLQQIDPVDLDGVFFVGTVVDNNDPECMERVRCTIENLYQGSGDELPWIGPISSRMFGNANGAGTFSVPQIGSKVWILMQQGDPSHPVYLGGHLPKSAVVGEGRTNYPNRYGFRDPQGNIFYIDFSTGDVKFAHNSGTFFTIDPSGHVACKSVDGMDLEAVSDINIKAGGNVNIKGAIINLN